MQAVRDRSADSSTYPAYKQLGRDVLAERARRAIATLADCRACPRDCGVNRLEDRWSACKTGRYAVEWSFFPHFGEEDCLRGWQGSGTIFFGHCNLRCVFCQNHDISQDIKPASERGSTPREIAAMMLSLQARGCHNINVVTPEHVAPQVVEAVSEAAALGLRLPIVYNTSAYDSPRITRRPRAHRFRRCTRRWVRSYSTMTDWPAEVCSSGIW
jgi:putative pyruvate formate lyase activating enzyme